MDSTQSIKRSIRKFFEAKNKLMAIAYKRRSDGRKNRQEASLDDQEKWCIEAARLNGEKITKWFVDDESAKEANKRPEFDAMLEYVKENPDNLYTWKLNRLCRNSLEEGRVKDSLEKGNFKKIVTVTGTFNPTDNILLASVELAMATQYSRDLSVDVVRRQKNKVESGGYVYFAPLGYWNDKNTKSIQIDQEKAPYIVKMFKLRAEGHSEAEITKILHNMGLRSKSGLKVVRSRINNYLRNPVYTGMTYFRGEYLQGNHEPIISKELFYRVKKVNEENRKVHKAKHNFVFKGLFTCYKCKGAITAEKQKGRYYYRCTKKRGPCTQKYIREDDLTEIVLNYFSYYQLPDQVSDKLIEIGTREIRKRNKEQDLVMTSYNQKISKLKSKLKILKEMRLNEEMDSEEYLKDRNEINENIDKLEIQMNDEAKSFEILEEELFEWLELMKNFGAWAKSLDGQNWRTIFNFVGSNYFLDDENIVIEQKNDLFKAIDEWYLENGATPGSLVELLRVIIRSYTLVKEMILFFSSQPA